MCDGDAVKGVPLIVLSACTADPTGVRLTIVYDARTPILDRFEVTGRADGESFPMAAFDVVPAGGATREETIAIQIGREMHGRSLVLAVGGLSSGTLIRTVETGVAIAAGEVVGARVSFVGSDPLLCGNRAVDSGEQCDDGNVASGDGCDAACQVEPAPGGWFERAAQAADYATSNAAFTEIPGARIDLTPASTGDAWLVLASGLLSSSAGDGAAEMRLMVGGEERDHFGAPGGGGWSGFLTFDLVTGTTSPTPISVELASNNGESRASSVRLVAVLLPAGAQVEMVSARDPIVVPDRPLETILRIDPTVRDPGSYLLLGGVAHQNDGVGTIATWMRTPGGGYLPDAPAGVRFSNATPAAQPVFVAERLALDRRGTFTLEGQPPAPVFGDWWDDRLRRRREIRVRANDPVPAGHAVQVVLDPALGSVDPSGRDVRLVYAGGSTPVEIDRVIEPGMVFTSTKAILWFGARAPIRSGDTDGDYFLYYDAEDPGALAAPPANPESVFPFFDDFDGAAFDMTRWLVARGAAGVANGSAHLQGPGASLFAARAYGLRHRYEARLRMSTAVDTFDYLGATETDGFIGDWITFWTQGGEHWAETALDGTWNEIQYDPGDPTIFHLYAFERPNIDSVDFFVDGSQVARSDTNVPTVDLGMYININSTEAMEYDWVRVRPILRLEPEVELRDEERQTYRGRWRHPRLLALRDDALAYLRFETSRAAVTTGGAYARLGSVALTEDRDYVVIQSIRVSGGADGTAARSGEIRVNGDTVLATSVRTDRGRGATGGHHHIAGYADIVRGPATLENGISAPDGQITVEGADSVIIAIGR
jgi:cysteine-rich repeat protein